MNEDILYTPEKIAQKLKITKGTVYEMIKREELEAHHIVRHLRISKV
ncbi:MAG TPA: helix-turn-helix domain-containing protein [Clostridiales bacterium]|nr:helix-turn-helix domain-containing protein [Clostridiales bacterium]